ncbi:MAG: hypothetical protein WBA93_31760 [Microcoleaceae cyanobacterium]
MIIVLVTYQLDNNILTVAKAKMPRDKSAQLPISYKSVKCE